MVSGRMVGDSFTVRVAFPRRVSSRTGSPSDRPYLSAVAGLTSASADGASSFNAPMRRVWEPDWYWASTRPVVRYSGYSSSGSSPEGW